MSSKSVILVLQIRTWRGIMNHSLNDNIKLLRKQLGISQVELAAELNVSKQCVSNWENDNVQPSIEMLVKLADFFNVSTDYLIGRSSKALLDASNLTDAQRAHISLLIKDLNACNQ